MQFPQATDTFASSARPPDDSQEIEREYLQRVRDECRYLDSEGVDQRRAELSEVFVMLEAVPSRRRESVADVAPVPERAEEMGFFGQLAERIGLKEPSRQAASSPPPPPPPPVPLSQVLKEHQRLVILGEPGTGKTTLLQFVALCFASDRWAGVRLGLDETRLPVRIALKTYDGIERLDRFIVQQLDRAYVPIETGQVWLAEGRLAILLDGLDEVQEGQRASVLNALQLFAGTQEGKNSRIVLTSRIAGYSGTTDFGEYTIKPLTGLDDASSYVAGWLSALQGTPPGTAQTEAEVLLAKMQQESSLRLVLTNPLLLRLAVALFVDTGEVARNRAELYRRYVEEVAWQRAQGRENCRWGLTQVEAALEIVAWTLHVKGLHTDGSLARAIASAEPEIDNSSDLVAYLRESMGLLASYGYYQGELVGFRHLTFQEYFVARRLYRAWTQDQKRAWRFIRPRLHHPAWREPILMMAAMLDENEATSFVARVWRKAHSPYERELHRDHLLAVLIVADRTSVDQRIANELVQSLVRLLLDVQVRWIHLLLHLLPWIVFFLPPVLVILSDLLFPAMPHFEINVQVVVVLILVSIVLQKLMVPLRRSGQGRYQHLRQQIIAALKVLPTNQKALAWQVLINRAITDSDVEPLLTWKVASVLNDIREPEVALAFIQDLSNTNSQVRWRGAVALGELNDLQAVVPLIHALADTDQQVRVQAAAALGKLDDPQAVIPLIQALGDEDQQVRRMAASVLGELDDHRAVDPLIQALGDMNWEVSSAAAESLGELGNPEAVAPLTSLLKDSSTAQVRRVAVEALGKIGDPQSVPYLAESLRDPDVSWVSARALGKLTYPESLYFLVEALGDAEGLVRRRAAEALGELGDYRAVGPLIHTLDDSHLEVREAAAFALGKIGDSQAVAPLVQALQAGEQTLRVVAAESLGKLGDPQAVASLIEALHDENRQVRRKAAVALGEIGDSRAVPPLVTAVSDTDWQVRNNASAALDGIDDPRTVPLLVQAMNDRNKPARIEAISALGKLGDFQATDSLIEASDSADSRIRRAAVEALGRIGDAQALVPLTRALNDTDRLTRRNAAIALGNINDPQVMRPLIHALRDNDGYVRTAVVEAMGEIGDPQAVGSLIRSVRDPDNETRKAAIVALAKIPEGVAIPCSGRATNHRLCLYLTNLDSDVNDPAWALLYRLVHQCLLEKVAALGDNPPLFASDEKPSRLSSTVLIILSVLVAALSGLASNIFSGLLLPEDLSTTSRLIISGSVFAVTLAIMIWLALRQRDMATN